MKRLLCFTLAVVMTFGIMPEAMAAYTDISVSNEYYNSALRLQDLGIIEGYDDGTFRAGENITRAEFTKVIVCMMDKETEAKTLTAAPAFSDVENGYWASTYINYAVSQDILSGYSDGSFGPVKNISFAEALTVLLRTIGYKESDVGYFWPNNYMDAAASLGISAGMNYQADEAITRGDAAIMIDRALFAKPSQSVASNTGKETYLETIGYTVLEDALILDNDTGSNNISILAGNLKLGSASTYVGRTQMKIEEGEVYNHAVIDKDGYLAAVNGYTDTTSDTKSETATVNRLTGNTIEYTATDGRKSTYKADDNFVMYYNNSKMTFATAKNYLTGGTEITFYGKGYGLWNVAVIGSTGDIDPVLASHNYGDDDVTMEGITINKENLIVYRDGKSATLNDIEVYDAVYYNTKTNTMDVYSKKVTGVYYDAKPSKAYVEIVTVGGKDYEIGYSEATGRLDASTGAFEIGDKITLILGKDDKIVFVTDNAGGVDYFSCGVVISSETKTAESGSNEGNTEFVTSMFMANGEVQEIVTSKLYKDNVGDLMRISYADGKATLSYMSQNKKNTYTGTIDVENRTIGKRYVLKDAVIIQRVSDEDAAIAECELLDFDKLTATKIDEGQILNVVTANAFGDIAILYVKNLETAYTYGVVTGFERNAENAVTAYKIFADGVVSSYSVNNIATISTQVGAGVGFSTENGNLKKITSMVNIDSSGKVDAVEGGRIMLDGVIYKMAPEVFIADITSNTNIRSITIDELAKMSDIKSVNLYSDKTVTNGGLIRVITIKTK